VTQGSRYNVTTGFDSNGDAYFNERPEGVTRNTRRGDVQLGTDLRLSWRPSMLQRSGGQGFGAERGQGGGGGQRGPGQGGRPGGPGGGQGGPGGRPGGPGGQPRGPERTFELFVFASNLFNRVNHTSYVGNLTSQLFGQPTSAGAARRIETGLRFTF
jgi:hypothetical protein